MLGGQAVIDGVMVRSSQVVSVAVRRRAGDLLVETWRSPSLVQVQKWLGLPVLRGIIVLVETLAVGVRAILLSANAAASSEDRPLTPREMGLTMGAGLVLAVALFFLLPTLAVRAIEWYLPSGLSVNLAEGLFRIVLLVGYVGVIGRVPDLRRVYQYHGAEHKAVNAFESGVPLEVNAVRACSRLHLRCGTSFVLMVMLVALAVFAFLDRPPLASQVLERMLLLPVLAGLSYEVFWLAGRFHPFRPLALPGIWLQRLTTLEPDDGQLRVAIRALRELLQTEGRAADQSRDTRGSAPADAGAQIIAVGLLCKGGFVLASGRLSEPSPDGPPGERPSAGFHDFTFDGTQGVITGDGESPFALRAKDVLEERGRVQEFHSSSNLADLVADAVDEIRGADRLRDPRGPRGRGRVPQARNGLHSRLLLAAYCGDEPCLYTVRPDGVRRQEGVATLGSGAALAEYLLARLYRPDLTPEEATRIAVYVIEEVKKSVPGGGGPIQVVVGGRGHITRKTEAEIHDIVGSLRERDEKLRDSWKIIARRPRVLRPRGKKTAEGKKKETGSQDVEP
jgi:uncharacterized protein YqhQ